MNDLALGQVVFSAQTCGEADYAAAQRIMTAALINELAAWLKERDPQAEVLTESESPLIPVVWVKAAAETLKELEDPLLRPAWVKAVHVMNDEQPALIFHPAAI